MREWIGKCRDCGRDIYCENGFLNGVVLEDQSLKCFPCAEQEDAGTSDSERQSAETGDSVQHSEREPD
ncbi:MULTISPECIES: hypothetical protein [Paenibacillus]|uniref:Uncharacterized protein n=1 Tax=Paenibacillus cineris TaxID=237530 RepID=A0ABQ4LNT8_9BACL|nr:hypothetical protein [Paenibacillus cineris]GIO58176.1 hypothetical protein J21TS7_64940 [Paenibacillus cineris]GIO64884.1 hypothetical protein J43TS9_64580 [Paenibacillus cineris]